MSGRLEEAVAHHRAGRLAEAERAYRSAIASAPQDALVHGLFGDVLLALGRDADAEAAYREALRRDPSIAIVHMNLGLALRRQRKLEDAVSALRGAVRCAPRLPEAHLNLGLVLQETGRSGEAMAAYQTALALRPDYAEAYLNLGSALHGEGRYDEARTAYQAALRCRPGYAEAHYSLGVTLFDQGDLEAAVSAYRQALANQPNHEASRNNLAFLLQALGQRNEAEALYRGGVAAGPHPETAARYLIQSTLYDPNTDLATRYREERGFEGRFAKPLYARQRPHANARDPGRRLRIGYLSSDFRDHPVGRNIGPLLTQRDRAGFEIFAYAEVAKPDRVTAQLRASVDSWRSTVGISDEQVARQIQADEIDILVVLAAHFDSNRPLVFAYRPAPIQISFHDLLTTGLEAVDYFIADRTVYPRGAKEKFTERVVRLPSLYVHEPLASLPTAPSARPAAGGPTFGSFNNPAKINEPLLGLWAKVLSAVPGSRLILKYRNWFLVPSLQARVRAGLSAGGVDPSRVVFAGNADDIGGHLTRYADIDIALDTSPFSGSTTTFEALWMGVPVVTLAGDTIASRWSASMLRVLRLDGLIAETPEAYVAAASALARDPARLGQLRSTLRESILRSPLVDGRVRARQIERVYRAVWRRWCARDR